METWTISGNSDDNKRVFNGERQPIIYRKKQLPSIRSRKLGFTRAREELRELCKGGEVFIESCGHRLRDPKRRNGGFNDFREFKVRYRGSRKERNNPSRRG